MPASVIEFRDILRTFCDKLVVKLSDLYDEYESLQVPDGQFMSVEALEGIEAFEGQTNLSSQYQFQRRIFTSTDTGTVLRTLKGRLLG